MVGKGAGAMRSLPVWVGLAAVVTCGGETGVTFDGQTGGGGAGASSSSSTTSSGSSSSTTSSGSGADCAGGFGCINTGQGHQWLAWCWIGAPNCMTGTCSGLSTPLMIGAIEYGVCY